MFLHLSFVIRFWLWWLSHSVISNSCNLVGYSLTGFSAMEFSRQEYWSGFLFPSPGELPHPWIEPHSPALAGRFFTAEPPRKFYISVDFLSTPSSLLLIPIPTS